MTRHSKEVRHRFIDGLPIADPAEVLLGAACHLGLLDLVILGDSALHLGDVTIDQVVAAARRRRRGAPALRTAILSMDGRSESPGETMLRLLHVTCHVPVEVQAPIPDEYDQIIARADLRIVGTRRLAEYDGAHHREAVSTNETASGTGACMPSAGRRPIRTRRSPSSAGRSSSSEMPTKPLDE